MSDPLATLDQLERFLGRALAGDESVRASDLLVYSSSTVRAYTGQTISQETTTQRLRIAGDRVYLPQWPVTSITSVMSIWDTPQAVPYAWDGDRVVWLRYGLFAEFDMEPLSPLRPASVDVEYEHGWATIPFAVVQVVLQVTSRALGRSAEDGGLQQEAIDGYSYQIGSTAAAGPTGLLPAEAAILDAIKAPTYPISVL